MQAKHYLKTDFKMHVRPSSNVADHCLSHALSEADSLYFEEECSHHHSDSCVHSLLPARQYFVINFGHGERCILGQS